MFLRLKHLQDFANKLAIKLKASFLTKQEGIDGIILEQDWQLIDTVTADSSITLPSLDTIEDIYIEMYTTDGTIIHQSSIKKDSLLFTSTNTSYREILLDSILDAQTYVTYYLDTNTIKATCCEGTDVTSESTSVTTKVYIRKISETGGVNADRVTYGNSTVAASLDTISTNVETNTKDITTLKNNISGMSSGPIGVLKGINYNINKINLEYDGWSNVSTIPYEFFNGGTILLNNEIHILGSSYDNNSYPYSRYHYKYNTSTNTWSNVNTLPYYFCDSSAIVLNNEIHILGSGYYINGSCPYSRYHYKYNTSTNTWSNVSTIPYEFFYGSAIVLNNEIHILGSGKSGYRQYHYKYNISNNTWSRVSTLPYEFYQGSAIVYNNEIHILGSNGSTSYRQYHYKYNTSTNTWSNVSTLPYEFYFGSAILLDNEIHILGSSNSRTSHYKYNTSTNTWSSVSTIPYDFYGGGAIVLDNEIHILGSYNTQTNHYKYNTSTGSIKSVELTDGTNTFTLTIKTS